jgi:uncharacterized protein (DUF924 family)
VGPEAVLEFWFAGVDGDAPPPPHRMALWFGADPALDAEVRARFGAAWDDAVAGRLGAWAEAGPMGRLALILVLDQLSRNIHRGRAEAFAGDDLARALAEAAIDAGEHLAVPPLYRLFFILPLEHHEDLGSQRRALALTEALAAEVPPALAKDAQGWVQFAEKHVELVRRFGRFPHRNAVLGRASTPEELAYLHGGGETFGQRAAEETP